MIDVVQFTLRIVTARGTRAKGRGRIRFSGVRQFHDYSMFNLYSRSESLLFYTLDTSSGFWMANTLGHTAQRYNIPKLGSSNFAFYISPQFYFQWDCETKHVQFMPQLIKICYQNVQCFIPIKDKTLKQPSLNVTKISELPISRNTPSCQAAWEEIFFGRKKREEKEEIFEKLLLNFERFFLNKDKLIEEIFEENVSIV